MKKAFTFILMLMVAMTMFGVTALAATKTVTYYDEDGNQIIVNGLYYNSQNQPMFNASCYYLDADGSPVYVGGCRVYYYNADGDLTAGNYYYDSNGKAVSRPASYPGGWGCGAWYYNAQGNVVNSLTYYDDFGNPVEPPATQVPSYRGGCCGWRW